MLCSLSVWLAGLILLLPVLVLASAWARRTRYYGGHEIPQRQKTLYLLAIVAASVSTVSYLGYWGWRVCGLYRVSPPLMALVILERFMYISEVLSAVAIICFFLGRGPYRFPLVLTTLWLMLPIWVHGRIIHWA
jgi:hypothetical protein